MRPHPCIFALFSYVSLPNNGIAGVSEWFRPWPIYPYASITYFLLTFESIVLSAFSSSTLSLSRRSVFEATFKTDFDYVELLFFNEIYIGSYLAFPIFLLSGLMWFSLQFLIVRTPLWLSLPNRYLLVLYPPFGLKFTSVFNAFRGVALFLHIDLKFNSLWPYIIFLKLNLKIKIKIKYKFIF